MRFSKRSCMACSLARRSALRHRMKTSFPPGAGVMRTSSPSCTSRQSSAQQLPLELAQRVLRRPDDVAPPALAQKLDVVFARHPAIHHPDPAGPAVEPFDVPDHLFQRGRVVAIAGEDFVAQRHAAAAHHQGDVDLLAVRPMIARIAPLRLRVLLRLTFKVGAGHVVQQQVVVELEQLSRASPSGVSPAPACAAAAHPAPGTERSSLTFSAGTLSRSGSALDS